MSEKSRSKSGSPSPPPKVTMNARTIRTILAFAIMVPCGALIVYKFRNPDSEIPWGVLLLWGIGLAGFSFLGRTESGIVRNGDDVFEKARKRLIDWMKVQAVIVFLFVGIAGFFIIQQAVQSSVNKEVERELKLHRKQIDNAAQEANRKIEGYLTHAAEKLNQDAGNLAKLVNQAAADATEDVRQAAVNAGRKAEQAVTAATDLADQLGKRIDELAVRTKQSQADCNALLDELESASAMMETIEKRTSELEIPG